MDEITEALAESALCHWCHSRIWPADQLDEHVLRHQLRYLVYLGELSEVQRIFRSMRFPGDKRARRKAA